MTEGGLLFVEYDEATAALQQTTLELTFAPRSSSSSQALAAHREAVASNGYVFLNGELMASPAEKAGAEGMVHVRNLKSVSMVEVEIPQYLHCEFSMVPPPAQWEIDEADRVQYSHINFRLKEVALSPLAHGVLGCSQRQRYKDGKPIMEGFDADGLGVVEGMAVDYEVETILSSEFKFAVMPPQVTLTV